MFGTVGALVFKNIQKDWMPIFTTHVSFIKRFQHVLYLKRISVINKGPKVDILPIFGSSKNDPKSFGICPGTSINHFGIIKDPQNPQANKKQRNPKTHRICLPYCGPYWTPFLGPGVERQ